MTVVVSGIPTNIVNLLQDRTLERRFYDALYPRLMFRSEATPEKWQANVGETSIQTRAGLIPVKTTALVPGTDPTPSGYSTEQWEVTASQYADTVDTNMAESYVSLASLYLQNTHALGLNAGETMNRLARNALYRAYCGGQTNTMAAAAAAATSVRVASINGFTQVLVNGRLQAVSSTNPLTVTFTTVSEPANTVISAVPDNPLIPWGPGTLFLGAALSVGCALRDGVRASTRSRVLRVGGGATVDALTTANILTLTDVTNAVAILRSNNVPPCEDGRYHIHLSPTAEAQIFQDNAFQRIIQSLPENVMHREQIITELQGSYWYRDTEVPNSVNTGTLIDTSGGASNARCGSEIGADVINQTAVPIDRTIVVGGSALREKYIDESKYITEAGITGKIGEFSITNNGIMILTERIRFIARSPLDRLQQILPQSWSWTGDFGVPSDFVTGSAARFKRAIVIEHA